MTPEETASGSKDPINERREAMIDILASWDLEGAVPDEIGLGVVREYVDGRLDLQEALLQMKVRPVAGQRG